MSLKKLDIEKYFKKMKYLDPIPLKLFCHKNFTEAKKENLIKKIIDNPENFNYCIYVLESSHFGMLIYKNKKPFCSLGLTMVDKDLIIYLNSSDLVGTFIGVPDTLTISTCRKFSKLTNNNSWNTKYTFKNLKNSFILKLGGPRFIYFGKMTYEQADYLKSVTLQSENLKDKFKNIKLTELYKLKVNFKILCKVKNNTSDRINCQGFTLNFLKYGTKSAKKIYDQMFSTTLMNTLSIISSQIRQDSK